MKKSHKLKILCAAVLALSLSSCEKDLLEMDNPSAVTVENFYKTEADALQAVNAAYQPLLQMYNTWMPYVEMARSDEEKTNNNAAGHSDVISATNFTTSSANNVINQLWQFYYRGIYRSNLVLDKVPAISMNENLQKQVLGEAKFLRAFYYYQLVTHFGEEVPMPMTAAQTEAEYKLPAAAPGAIWQQIITDLKEAQNDLPVVDDYRKVKDQPNLGRATKGAATGLLGKVYLRLKQYQPAADEFAKIITQKVGTYSLVPNYKDNFNDATENNVESLFEIQFHFDPAWKNAASFGSMRAQSHGMNNKANGQRWWNANATQAINDEFEAGDPRKFMTLWTKDGAKFEDTRNDKNGNKIVVILDFAGQNWASYGPGVYGWRKYEYDFNWRAKNGQNYDGNNFRYMRYADVLLMYAECRIEGASGPVTAEAAINEVRMRANNKVPTEQAHLFYATQDATLPMVQDLMKEKGWDLRTALRHERMVELAGELVRWEDIVRWDIGTQVIKEPDFSAPKSYLYPIPQRELDTNPNAKPNIAN